MSDRPILFSAPMIRALLAGRKTQTRRIIKPQPGPCNHTPWADGASEFRPRIGEDGLHCATCGNGLHFARTKSGVRGIPIRFAKGDRLWVRETWKPHSVYSAVKPRDIPPSRIFYAADDPSNTPWRPGIFLPRWASRLTLTVTDVRVERLQDIDEIDAVAEGIIRYDGDDHDNAEFSPIEDGDIYGTAVDAYEDLWRRINGALSWAANPWIVAITFAVEERNIDAGGPV